MTNKFAIIKILQKIKENGNVIRNMKFRDDYFIFEMGKDTVCHFEVKGCHGWKFGIWLDTDSIENKNNYLYGKDQYIMFFAQHKRNIDKFKPSYSHYQQSLSKEEFNAVLKDSHFSLSMYHILDIITEIKHHPLVAFHNDLTSCTYLQKTSEMLKTICGSFYREFKDNLTKLINNSITIIRNKVKIIFMSKSKKIYEIEFKDRNKNGWIHYPRYELNIVFKDGLTDEEHDKFIDFWKTEKYQRNVRVEHFVEIEDKEGVVNG